MKHWVNPPSVREFQLVCLSPNLLQNFVRAAKLLLQFMRNALEPQVLGTQEDQIPNYKLCIPSISDHSIFFVPLLPSLFALVIDTRSPVFYPAILTTFLH